MYTETLIAHESSQKQICQWGEKVKKKNVKSTGSFLSFYTTQSSENSVHGILCCFKYSATCTCVSPLRFFFVLHFFFFVFFFRFEGRDVKVLTVVSIELILYLEGIFVSFKVVP